MESALAEPGERCEKIKDDLTRWGLYSPAGDTAGDSWRISPAPFLLDAEDAAFLNGLGNHLLAFYTALNRLYFDSLKGRVPAWVADYLDAGKPSDLLGLSQMKRFKTQLPGIIRPDLMVTDGGFAVTELDSVPGGFGRTAGLMALYDTGDPLIGQENGGIPALFHNMLQSVSGKTDPRIALLVSDEAQDYLAEMQYLGGVLRERGVSISVCHPRDILFREEGLYIEEAGEAVPLDAVYRFYELFDLRNIPKAELIAYAVKKGKVALTPPYKPQLEEKLSFALFHHPVLRAWWEKQLGDETFGLLSHLIPRTWILDDRPLPPQAVIPGLKIRGNALTDWEVLFSLTQKERELVVKTSGFSPTAWGARGVVVGHDVPQDVWEETLRERLQKFPQEPSILQEFHKGKRFGIHWWDEASGTLREMQSRVRLTPYYFVVENEARLGGVLATLCPQDKKKIHGMTDAVMVPCGIAGSRKKDCKA
ncbi:MAG: hypothetical protein KC553_00975 [Nitrospina sp.]|nr:hypothetical protein [Nitrospina sp.]